MLFRHGRRGRREGETADGGRVGFEEEGICELNLIAIRFRLGGLREGCGHAMEDAVVGASDDLYGDGFAASLWLLAGRSFWRWRGNFDFLRRRRALDRSRLAEVGLSLSLRHVGSVVFEKGGL